LKIKKYHYGPKNKKKWIIEDRMKLQQLFTNNLKTISRIDDFKRKTLMNFWFQLRLMECPLCNHHKFGEEHLLNDCDKVKEWEIEIYGIKKRKMRINSQYKVKESDHTLSWIYNWCIWKNLWEIFYKKFKNSEQKDPQIKNLKKLMKTNEYIHLVLISETRNFHKNATQIEKEIKNFSFYSF